MQWESGSLNKAVYALAHFLYDGLQQQIEAIRIARVAYALISSGCSLRGPVLGDSVPTCLLSVQRTDGGWADVEETLWCLGYLAAFGERYGEQMVIGQKWLASVQLPCGAWGKSDRDQPRIPMTALAAILVPEVVDSSGLKWLASQWEADLASPTQLTYKGAFFLLARAHSQASYDSDLVNRTITYLCREQEEDGGFGPWKGHPVGSDPWSTGVALWGLSKVRKPVPGHTIERALSWLKSKQFFNGLWPYHYLDDGAALALIGASSILSISMER